ncbi:MAG: glycosyltransferase family 2 protein [bacterium]|nr:glycosyltransferase family 2 protein [bacterium]
MSPLKVSILITTWNRAHLISRAIQSAIDQNFKDWELIIADDGSTDNTEKICKEWEKKDHRIKYLRAPHFGRIAKISNFGLKHTQGEYIAILDDDDMWAATDKLDKQVKFLDENKDYVACGGGYVIIDKNEKEKSRLLKPEEHESIIENALLANPMVNTTTIFRKSIAEKIGFYDETLPEFADWNFWLKMGLEGKLYNFPLHFAYYQMWDTGSSFSKQKGTAYSSLQIVPRYKGKYPHYKKAITLAYAYYIYTLLPNFIKKFLNPVLSRFKKTIFSA